MNKVRRRFAARRWFPRHSPSLGLIRRTKVAREMKDGEVRKLTGGIEIRLRGSTAVWLQGEKVICQDGLSPVTKKVMSLRRRSLLKRAQRRMAGGRR